MRNGEVEETGLGAGVLNQPARGIAWLANRLALYGQRIEAGQIVLSGSFIRPIECRPGDTILADFGPLGTVGCHLRLKARTMTPNILLIGTCDTKADEIQFLRQVMQGQGATVAIMDVGVLGKPRFTPDYPNDAVAQAAGTTIADIAAYGDENEAMTKVAEGAVALTRRLYAEGKVQGMIALGGSMGTDLALDVAACLPIGTPKFVVSTIAFSHLLPPERIPADVMMILWSGGLYGLNSICRAALSQAAGAVVGAARAAVRPLASAPRSA